MSTHRARPTSEIFFQNPLKSHQPDPTAADHVDKVTEKWLADLEIYQHTLEEMASINLDQEFKDELNAVQQWFEVLSMGERTAALYALLQDSSQVQVRFFITVLKRMAQNDTIAGVLSPTTGASGSGGLGAGIPTYDPYSRQSQSPRFNSSSNTNTPKSEGSGPSNLTSSPVTKPSSFKNIHRHSPSVNSNLSSSIITPQYITQEQPSISSIASLISPNLESTPLNGPGLANAPYLEKLPSNLTPWVQSEDVINRPKSADVALGTAAAHASLTSSPVYYKPPPSIGADIKRYTSTPPPPGINISNAATQPLIPTTGATLQDDGLLQQLQQLQLQQPTQSLTTPQFIYPEFQGASWASMSNTPTAAMFSPIPTTFASGVTAASPAVAAASTTANVGTNGSKINAEIASATAMKMAALSTVSSRVILDHDVKKFRRNNKNVVPLDLDGSGAGSSAVNSPITSEFGNQGKVINQQLVYPPVSSPLVDRTQYLNSYSMALLSPVPPPQPHEYGNGRIGGNGHRKQSGLNKKSSSQPISSSSSNTHSPLSSTAGAAGSNNTDPTSFELALLADVPQWLKTLRLHKYTEQLKDLAWRDLVALSDAQLEARGVNALGARRKMLKVFEQVREADAQGSIK
ncbi:hypothetical protein D0Z00_000366 [Geotrichum galactomycetum]|uniref:Uncharacterized protein n=1 Tax=Geotrichum galactomycetum TaxID=27317 RepID=A0ACB6V9W4_9ASCO|nr:hypothetical protein D0Z00_000366 [Geotrichum candidum]